MINLTSMLLTMFLTVQSERPNVVLIVMDDLRSLTNDSAIITPNLDELSNESIVFDNAYCQQAICNPSRASFLTGLRPTTLGIFDLETNLRDKYPRIVTMPEFFKSQGYYTVSYGKIFHHPDPQSWSESWHSSSSKYFIKENQEIEIEKGKGPLIEYSPKASLLEYPDGQLARKADNFFRQKKRDKPFFLALGFTKPHLPFNAPIKFMEQYEREKITAYNGPNKFYDRFPLSLTHGIGELKEYLLEQSNFFSDSVKKEMVLAYYSTISYADFLLGYIYNSLLESGLAHNTIIIITSDHGIKLGGLGAYGKNTCYDIDLKVPLIIKVPGVSHKAIPDIVELIDIYPTILDLTGIEKPSYLEGKSLQGFIKHGQDVEYDKDYAIAVKRVEESIFCYSIRRHNLRYSEWIDLDMNPIGEYELYDYRNNRFELKNIYDNNDYNQEIVENKSILSQFIHPKEFIDEFNLELWPNPVLNVLNIQLPFYYSGLDANISIINLSGKQLYTDSFFISGNNKIDIDLNNFLSGLYIVRISSTSNDSRTFKIIKN